MFKYIFIFFRYWVSLFFILFLPACIQAGDQKKSTIFFGASDKNHDAFIVARKKWDPSEEVSEKNITDTGDSTNYTASVGKEIALKDFIDLGKNEFCSENNSLSTLFLIETPLTFNTSAIKVIVDDIIKNIDDIDAIELGEALDYIFDQGRDLIEKKHSINHLLRICKQTFESGSSKIWLSQGFEGSAYPEKLHLMYEGENFISVHDQKVEISEINIEENNLSSNTLYPFLQNLHFSEQIDVVTGFFNEKYTKLNIYAEAKKPAFDGYIIKKQKSFSNLLLNLNDTNSSSGQYNEKIFILEAEHSLDEKHLINFIQKNINQHTDIRQKGLITANLLTRPLQLGDLDHINSDIKNNGFNEDKQTTLNDKYYVLPDWLQNQSIPYEVQENKIQLEPTEPIHNDLVTVSPKVSFNMQDFQNYFLTKIEANQTLTQPNFMSYNYADPYFFNYEEMLDQCQDYEHMLNINFKGNYILAPQYDAQEDGLIIKQRIIDRRGKGFASNEGYRITVKNTEKLFSSPQRIYINHYLCFSDVNGLNDGDYQAFIDTYITAQDSLKGVYKVSHAHSIYHAQYAENDEQNIIIGFSLASFDSHDANRVTYYLKSSNTFRGGTQNSHEKDDSRTHMTFQLTGKVIAKIEDIKKPGQAHISNIKVIDMKKLDFILPASNEFYVGDYFYAEQHPTLKQSAVLWRNSIQSQSGYTYDGFFKFFGLLEPLKFVVFIDG
ncbi:MAG TPA: hypothetical protein PKC21_01110 [Oligoflexia bacterium]|nr:hypothetical protein [Oligoflexia bacterium]HMR23928.1 hypothetical protein [Oligoflexia bacterium]